VPDVEDDFSASTLRRELWIDHYLPHWTIPERSQARYTLDGESGLRLLIEHDQLDWRPEDAPLRVSNLQTGVFSGPLGSERGTHRHRPDGLDVRTPTSERLLWAPTSGRIEVTVSASIDEGCMLAVWLVGAETVSTDHSGEICVFEIDASAIGSDAASVRSGIKAHGDPALVTEMVEAVLPFDASRPHTWTAVWGPAGTVIACEGTVVMSSAAAPDYPMVLMVDLFEIGPPSADPSAYPKQATIHSFRGWNGLL
jgi:hypothetical protein